MKLRCPNCQVIHTGIPGDLFACICGTQLRAPKKKSTKEEEVISRVKGLFDMLADAMKQAKK